jgi:hypothetical protein
MRTHSLAHNLTDVSAWEQKPEVQQLSGTAANEAVLNPANVEHAIHPGLRNAAKIGSVFLILIAMLLTIAYILG